MILNDIQVVLGLAVFVVGIYFSYKRGMQEGYHIGYEDACVDVAHGNIIVKLGEEK